MRHILTKQALKTDHILSLFSIIVISVTSFSMYFILTVSLKSDIENDFIQSHSKRAINLSNQIVVFLDTRRIQLASVAQKPILQQAVMRPADNTAALGDFLNHEKIIGNNYEHTVFDFKGDIIYSNNKRPTPLSDKSEKRIDSLLKGEKQVSINISPDLKYWEVALPILYGRSVEGALLTLIPIQETEDLISLNDTIALQIKISSTDGTTITWGENSSQQWVQVYQLDKDLSIYYSIDTSAMKEAFSSANTQLLSITIVIFFLGLAVSILIGRHYFVDPILRLQELANNLSDSSSSTTIHGVKGTKELNDLAYRFALMTEKIKTRERSLLKAHQALERNQDQLLYAEKMSSLGKISAGVAHEINNPIGFIMANLETLQEYHAYLRKLLHELLNLYDDVALDASRDTSKRIKTITSILGEDDLDFLMNDLSCITDESIVGAERVRDITKAMKGYAYSGEQVSLVNLNECIESTVKMVWNELKYNCTIEKILDADIPPIECIGGQIDQVLLNIIMNAAHAVNNGNGLIKISSSFDDKSVFVDIEDNGYGIKEEHLKQIFIPFFTTKEVGEGTGLGMSICYDIVKNHGGNITVKSKLGKGTTFSLTLPINNSNKKTE